MLWLVDSVQWCSNGKSSTLNGVEGCLTALRTLTKGPGDLLDTLPTMPGLSAAERTEVASDAADK
jgi:hypothetical protein